MTFKKIGLSMNQTLSRPGRKTLAPLALVLALLTLPLMAGCRDAVGWVANAVGGGDEEVVYSVDAKYPKLGTHTVAIVVEADQYVHFQYPAAPATLQRAIARELKLRLPDVRLTNPSDIEKFQRENPYWNTIPYGELLKRLNVERVILVDIAEYSLHEPGNANVWRGYARASVGVLEDNAPNPSNFAFSDTAEALYPTDSKVGVLNSDDATMQKGLSERFAQKVVGLFYDHKMKEKK